MKPSKVTKENCRKAYDLRKQGLTYLQIGLSLGISEPYARHLVQVNQVIQQRQPIWTDGLSPRVSNAIRHAGFSSKQDVMVAFQHTPQKIHACIGLGECRIKELRLRAVLANTASRVSTKVLAQVD